MQVQSVNGMIKKKKPFVTIPTSLKKICVHTTCWLEKCPGGLPPCHLLHFCEVCLPSEQDGLGQIDLCFDLWLPFVRGFEWIPRLPMAVCLLFTGAPCFSTADGRGKHKGRTATVIKQCNILFFFPPCFYQCLTSWAFLNSVRVPLCLWDICAVQRAAALHARFPKGGG